MIPQISSPTPTASTSVRLRRAKLTRNPIMPLLLGRGGELKSVRGHLVLWLQSASHLHESVARLGSQLQRDPAELIAAGRNKHPVFVVQMNNGSRRNYDPFDQLPSFERGGHEHPDAHDPLGIGQLDANLRGARCRIEQLTNVNDPPGGLLIGIGV